ncbi:MAG TPA: hypothetical protein VJ001_01880 [Rhodocyclaceae bacterium]|nr:hypothetical protein [Rhodocyclaceae bacterium]
MKPIAQREQTLLDCLTLAVAEELERKRRLGHYAVIWNHGQPELIGDDAPSPSTKEHTAPKRRRPHPDIAGKAKTLGDLL